MAEPAKALKKLIRIHNGRGTHKDVELVGFIGPHTAMLCWPGAGHYELDLRTGKIDVVRVDWRVDEATLAELNERNRLERGLSAEEVATELGGGS